MLLLILSELNGLHMVCMTNNDLNNLKTKNHKNLSLGMSEPPATGEWEKHYQWELARADLPTPSAPSTPEGQAPGGRSKRGAAVLARQNISSSQVSNRKREGCQQPALTDDEKVGVTFFFIWILCRDVKDLELFLLLAISFIFTLSSFSHSNHDNPSPTTIKLLLKIKANRLKRSYATGSKNVVDAGFPSRKKRQLHLLDEASEIVAAQKSACFMCGKTLPSDANAVNAHIDECLRQQSLKVRAHCRSSPITNSNSSITTRSASPVIEEYSWAGQTRVRITTMLEGGFEANGFSVRKKTDRDVDEDINIDDDDEDQYGTTQYTESNLKIGENGENDLELETEPPDEPTSSTSLESLKLQNLPADSKLIVEALITSIKERETKTSARNALFALTLTKSLSLQSYVGTCIAKNVGWNPSP
ncbi:hypothetical protein BC829DRAFT_420956 [Chytridium lagenaria]|nr:hypothetical protein BC829DRAFT_420956 [Chytridium lagenaria]